MYNNLENYRRTQRNMKKMKNNGNMDKRRESYINMQNQITTYKNMERRNVEMEEHRKRKKRKTWGKSKSEEAHGGDT